VTTKLLDGRPAILGGTPAFSPSLPFTKPAVVDFAELAPDFQAICESGMLSKGQWLGRLEAALAEKIGAKHVVCVNSCTAGLLLGIQSLKLSGEVIVPSFSFMATFHALRWNGLTPIFVDCDPETLTIDLKAVEAAITPRTCAVMSAYLFGNPPDMVGLDEICRRHKLYHFCDSAHGMGTLIDGKPAGTHAEFEVFSASPTKVLTAGEGGVVATNNPCVAEWVRIGRDYGNPGDYDCRFPGLNGRMSEFHAVLMLRGLAHLEDYVLERERVVRGYTEGLGALPGVRFQKIREGCRSSRKDFPIIVEESAFGLGRDALKKALELEGIPTRAYFDPPGHHQTPYRTDQHLPITEQISSSILCLPISSTMTDEQVERVVAAIARIQQHGSQVEGVAAG
jgi:dTDP-4-amino-4,6-dideoxygalactose transaminase